VERVAEGDVPRVASVRELAEAPGDRGEVVGAVLLRVTGVRIPPGPAYILPQFGIPSIVRVMSSLRRGSSVP
jgi:hypothetical protein